MAVKDYLDPRWQKLRLRILDRDGFKCVVCNDADSTLHVHHRAYEKKKKIWDAKPDNLVTLCESCHERCERIVVMARKAADSALLSKAMSVEKGDAIPETSLETHLLSIIDEYAVRDGVDFMEVCVSVESAFSDAATSVKNILKECR